MHWQKKSLGNATLLQEFGLEVVGCFSNLELAFEDRRRIHKSGGLPLSIRRSLRRSIKCIARKFRFVGKKNLRRLGSCVQLLLRNLAFARDDRIALGLGISVRMA